jgi:CRISPR-associated protein Csx14
LVDEVIVVYLASSARYQESFRKLAGEFPGDRYQGQSIHLRPMPIRWSGRLLEFVRQPHEVEAVRRSFFDLFRELKARGQRIFLSVAGGRRMLSLLAMSTAMRHFTTEDRLYHLYTPAEIRDQAANGALMHIPPGSGVHLIEVPLVPWGVYLPGLAPLLGESPSAVRAVWQDESERERCQQVWAAITARQRDALRELALGRSRQQAAERLGVSVTTVDTHKTEVFNQCRMAWMDADLKFDTHFLRERFKPFLVGLGEV